MTTQNRDTSVRFRSELVIGGAAVVALCTYSFGAPEGAQVVRGNVNITRDGALTTIRAGNRSIINFRSFDLSAHETVRFIQPSSTSSVLNRITNAAPSFIDGTILANGRVYFMNPAGITFGPNSVVNVGTLIAGAGTISDADFLRDTTRFTQLRGGVFNHGQINADAVALLGQSVGNFGQVNAPNGTVVMAAGQDVLIGRRRDRVYAKVTAAGQAVAEGQVASVTNAGQINAPGGQVVMSAADTFGAALFNAGQIKAARAEINAGRRGRAIVSGTVDVSNTQGTGGEVTITGQRVELQGANINASGSTGGGVVLVGGGVQGQGLEENATTTFVDANSMITANATETGDGGTVVLWSDGANLFTGSISATGSATGKGGFVEVSGDHLGFYGDVDVANGGTLLLDPRDLRIVAVSGTPISSVDQFSDSPNTDSDIAASTITAVLNAGGNVTLAANRDLFVDVDINVVLNGGVLEGGDLTLRAQRDIVFASNVDIVTQGGDLFINANTVGGTLASLGVRIANPGAGDIIVGSAVSLDVGTGTLTFAIDPPPLVPPGDSLYLPGTLQLPGSYNITAANTVLQGNFLGDTGSQDLFLVTSGGGITIASNTRIDARSIALWSLDGGLSIAGPASLSAPTTIDLAAFGAGGVISGVNNLTVRDTFTTTGSPTDFRLSQDADLLDSNQIASSQFGPATLPQNLLYQSFNGRVIVTSADKINGSNVDLVAGDGVTINTIGVATPSSLLIRTQGDVSISSAINITNSRTQAFGADANPRTFSFASTGFNGFEMSAPASITGVSNLYVEHNGAAVVASMTTDATHFISINAQSIGQVGGILTAGGLALRGSDGAIDLSYANQIGRLAMDTSMPGDNTVGAAGALEIGPVDGLGGIVTNGTNLTLIAGGAISQLAGIVIDLDGGVFSATSAGYTQGLGAQISASGIALADGGLGGDFLLDQAGNQADALAALITGGGKLYYKNNGALAIDTVGAISGIDPSELLLDVGGALTINSDIVVPGGLITLRADSISQSAGTSITGDRLAVITNGGPGAFNLNRPGNSVNTFAADVGGPLAFQNAGAFTVGQIATPLGVVTGITTTNDNARLTSGGLLTLAQNILLGNARLEITSAGADQTGGIINANAVLMQGTGAFILNNANTVNRVAADVTGNVNFRSTGALTVGTVGGVSGVDSGGGNIRLRSGGALFLDEAVSAGVGDIRLQGAGITQDAEGLITGAGLGLHGTGDITLTQNNTVSRLAGDFTGNLDFVNTTGLDIGTVLGTTGLNSNAFNITLNLGGAMAMQAGAQITATGSLVTLISHGASQAAGAGITADELALFGSAAGDFNLDQANRITTLAAGVDGDLTFTNLQALTIGTLTGLPNPPTTGTLAGIATNSHDVTLSAFDGTDGFAITQQAGKNIDAGTARVTISGSSFSQDPTAGITAGELALVALGTGGGPWTLGGGNDVDTLAADVRGDLFFNDLDALTVGTVAATPFGDVNGVFSDGNNITLRSGDAMTLTQRVDAGPGGGTVILHAAANGLSQTGGVVRAGGLSLEGGGDFSLPSANEISVLAAVISGNLAINTVGGYTIGTVGSKSGLNIGGDLELCAEGGTLVIASDLISTGRITICFQSVQQTTGRVEADELALIAVGAPGGSFIFDRSDNDVNTLAADILGEIYFRDIDDLTIGTITGTPHGDISGIDVDPADVTLVMPGLLSINAPIISPGTRVTLHTGGAVQAPGTFIIASELVALSFGPSTANFDLFQAGNNVATFAANVGGSLDYRDNDVFTVGSILGTPLGDIHGIQALGGGGFGHSVRLRSGNTMTLAQGINVGNGRVRLITGGGLSQTGGILIADRLQLEGIGPFTVTQNNLVRTLAGDFDGNLDYRNDQSLTIAGVNPGTPDGLASNGGRIVLNVNGLLTLDGNLDATGAAQGLIDITSNGVTQTSGLILGGGLKVRGTGIFSMQRENLVDTIAADITGPFSYTSGQDFTVGHVDGVSGITTGGDDVLLIAAAAGDPGQAFLITQAPGADIDASGARVTIAAGGYTQALPSRILASELALIALNGSTGGWTLEGGNDVTNFGARVGGALIFNDVSTLFIESILGTPFGDVVGVNSGDSAVTLRTGGLLTLRESIISGTGITTLDSQDGVSQASIGAGLIDAAGLSLQGVGTFALLGPNEADVLAAQIGNGSLEYNSAITYAIGDIGTKAGVSVFGGDITLCSVNGLLTIGSDLVAPGNRITICAAGAEQTGGVINAEELALIGTGPGNWDLFGDGNTVVTLAADVIGSLRYRDLDGLNIDTLTLTPHGDLDGVTTNGNALQITAGGLLDIKAGANVIANNNRITFQTAGAVQGDGSRILGNQLVLIGNGPSDPLRGPAVLIGLGDFLLEGPLNNVSTIVGDTIGMIKYRNQGALTVGTIDGTPIGRIDGLTTHNHDLFVRTDSGALTLAHRLDAGPAAMVRLQTFSAPITQTFGPGVGDTPVADNPFINAGRLIVLTDGPGGNVELPSLTNQVIDVAALVDGRFRLTSSVSMRVTTLNDPNQGGLPIVGIDTVGIAPGAGDILLNTLGGANLLIGQRLHAPDRTIRLQTVNGFIEQTGGPGDDPTITGRNLLVLTAGPSAHAFLDWAGNNVRNLAADMTGELRYRDASDLFVTTVADPLGGAVSGVDTHGFDITVRVQDLLTLEQSVRSGTNTSVITTLESFTSDIVQTGGHILAGELRVKAPGEALLTSLTNDVDLLDAFADSGINFVNSVPLGVIHAVTVNSPIRLSNADHLTVLDEINAGTSTVALLVSNGAHQVQNSKIIASNLYLRGAGPAPAGNFLFANVNTENDVDVLAADLDGQLNFDDVDGLTIGQVTGVYNEVADILFGIRTNNHDALLRSGTLGNLGGITIVRPIDLSPSVGGASTALLRLETYGGDIDQTGPLPTDGVINTGRLLTITLAPGHVQLENPHNRISQIAGDVGGYYRLISLNDVLVDTITDPFKVVTGDRLRILGAEAFIQAPALTVNKPLDASADGPPVPPHTSFVRLTVDNLQINDIPGGGGFIRSGNSDTSGVWVRTLTLGRDIRLGDETGSRLRLTQTELHRIYTPLLQLGEAFAGDITTTPINLNGGGGVQYDLVLRGRGITTAGLLMSQDRQLALWAEETGVSAPGAVTAGELVLRGRGAFILANAANDFGIMAADVIGPNTIPAGDAVHVADANSLIVDDLETRTLDGKGVVGTSGISALSGWVRLTTGPGNLDRLTLHDGPGSDVATVIYAPDGGVVLTTNNISINRLVESSCRVFIAPVTAGRPVILGGAPGLEPVGTLVIDDAELNRILSGGGVAVGGAATGGITVEGLTYGGSFLQVEGASVRLPGGVTMTGGNALFNIISDDVRQQGAGFIAAPRLGLLGSGEFLLTGENNDVDLIAGEVGSLRYMDRNGFEVGRIDVDAACHDEPPTYSLLGIDATGSAALITRGLGVGNANDVFITENIAVGDTLVLASLALVEQPRFYQDIGTTVIAPNLLMNGRMEATLDQPFNGVQNLSGLITGDLALRSVGDLHVTTLNDFVFVPQAGDVSQRTQTTPGGFDGFVTPTDVTLVTGATGRITLDRRLVGDEVLIDSEGLGRTSGFLQARVFTFTGGADIALGVGDAGDGVDGVNRVQHLALLPQRVMTEVDFANDAVTPLVVDVGDAHILDGRVYLRARSLRFDGPFVMAAAPGSVDPEAAAVRLTTNAIDVGDDIIADGGILVRGLTSGLAVTLGSNLAGTLALSGEELARLHTGRTVQIGSTTAGLVSVSNAADLNYNLTLVGRGVSIGAEGLGLIPGKTLMLLPQLTGVVQTTGAGGELSATNLLILGTGPVNLANDLNDVTNAAIETNGAITFHNDTDLFVTLVEADDLAARNAVVRTGDSFTSTNKAINVEVTASLTAQGDIDAGTSVVNLFVTDTLDVQAGHTVQGDAGITIDPVLMILGPGAKVLSQGANGFVHIVTDGAQWDPSSLIVGSDGVTITTLTTGRTIRIGGSSIYDNPGELGLSDAEMLVIGGDTEQVDINAAGAGHIIVDGDGGVADPRYIDLTKAPYDLVLRANQPGAQITFFRGFYTSGDTLRFIGPSTVRESIVLATQSSNQNSVRFDGDTTFGLLGSDDVPGIDSWGVTLNFNGHTAVNRTSTINTRVGGGAGDAFANPHAGRLVWNGNFTGLGGLNLLTPLTQWVIGTDPGTGEPIYSRLPQIAFNTDAVTRQGFMDIGYLRINVLRDEFGNVLDGPTRDARPPIPTIVFNFNGFQFGEVGAYTANFITDFSVATREQLLMYGPMDITAGGGMLLSDMNILGDPGTTNNHLRLAVGPDAQIEVWTRRSSGDDQSTLLADEFDIGASIVVQGDIALVGTSTFRTRQEPGGAGGNNIIYVLRPEGASFTEANNPNVFRRIFSAGDNIDIRQVRLHGFDLPGPLPPYELNLYGFVQAIGDDELNLAEALANALATELNNDAAGPQGNLSDQQIQSLARLNVFVRRPGTLDLVPTRFGRIIIDTSRNPTITPDGQFIRSVIPTDFNVAEPRLTEERVDRLIETFNAMFAPDGSGAAGVQAAIGKAWDEYMAAGGNGSGSGFRAFLEAGNSPEALALLNQARDLFLQLDQLGLSDTELVFPKRTIAGLMAPKPEMVGALLDAIGPGTPAPEVPAPIASR